MLFLGSLAIDGTAARLGDCVGEAVGAAVDEWTMQTDGGIVAEIGLRAVCETEGGVGSRALGRLGGLYIARAGGGTIIESLVRVSLISAFAFVTVAAASHPYGI